MKKALYRKYRPTSLDNVVGEDHITGLLKREIEQDRIAHAYLFTGPRGTGKTSVARIFAHEINGFPYEVEDEYIDIIEIDAASNTGVDNIRELREKAVIAPSKGKYKVYIIDEIHMLSKSAFNALLKMLEEPPEHVIFVMATTDAYKVPITITSRARILNFQLADKATMIPYLKEITKKEQIKITDEALEIVARRGGGSFRDTLSLLDQVSTLSDSEITAEKLNNALGLPQEEQLKKILGAYESSDLTEVVTILKEIINNGNKPEILAAELVKMILEDPKPQFLPLLSKLTEVGAPYPEAKLLLALTSELGQGVQNKSFLDSTGESSKKAFEARVVLPKKQGSEQNKPIEIENITKPTSNFNWTEFLEIVKSENPVIFSALTKAVYEMNGEVVNLTPASNWDEKLLKRASSKELLAKSGQGYRINVGEPKSLKNDASIGQISAIMGDVQEVKDGGAIPF